MGNIILEARSITMDFPGVRALDSVDFDLREGEVHILVGENGAGKSTLSKIILGVYKETQGELFLDGKKLLVNTPKDSLHHGIIAVYQEFTLVPYLNISQNIFLNREYKNKFGLIDHRRMEIEARELLDTLNCTSLNVKTLIKDLSVAEQQMVEIAKALSFKPRIIVFDEPSATLSEKEIDSLFEQILQMKKSGLGIIYVSHRMQEFPRIGDRITVLRDGKKISTVGINEVTNEKLVNMMVGREISQVFNRKEPNFGEEILRVEEVSDKEGKVKNASLYVRKHEIVGICGLVGAGRTELAQLIFGIRKKISGKIYLNGEEIQMSSPVKAVKNRIGLVPEDRKKFGLALNDSIALNIISVSLRKYFKHYIISYKKIFKIAEKFIKILRVATPSAERQCMFLSGGNQQKVVLAKWLSADNDLLIFDEPTRGIDVGAKYEIYELMDQLAKEGKAIIMISSELPEVVGMSDRIYIMKEGTIKSGHSRNELTQDQIGAIMLGVENGTC